MFSVAVDEKANISIVDIPDPSPRDYEAVVKLEVGYLCNATDGEIIHGKLPAVTRYPTLLGHENAGRVVEVGKKVRSYKTGDLVAGGLLLDPTDSSYSTGFGGFSEYVIASDYSAMVEDGKIAEKRGDDIVSKIMRTIPSDIPSEAAGLFCMWREVLGSFADFDLLSEKRHLVFGGGPVGQSFVKFASLLGAEYIALVDSHPEKQDLAKKLGADEIFVKDDSELNSFNRGGSRIVGAIVDAVGKEDILAQAVSMVPEEGKVCVYGLYEEGTCFFDIKKAPRNWNLIFHQWPLRDSEASSQERLVEWIRSGELDWKVFVSAEYPIKSISSAVRDVESRKATKVLLRF